MGIRKERRKRAAATNVQALFLIARFDLRPHDATTTTTSSRLDTHTKKNSTRPPALVGAQRGPLPGGGRPGSLPLFDAGDPGRASPAPGARLGAALRPGAAAAADAAAGPLWRVSAASGGRRRRRRQPLFSAAAAKQRRRAARQCCCSFISASLSSDNGPRGRLLGHAPPVALGRRRRRRRPARRPRRRRQRGGYSTSSSRPRLRHQAHLPALDHHPQAEARLLVADAEEGREGRHREAESEGEVEADCVKGKRKKEKKKDEKEEKFFVLFRCVFKVQKKK